jgi:hypothetical protein
VRNIGHNLLVQPLSDREMLISFSLSDSVAGHVYFSCPAKRGIFVRPERVQVGDYEEVDEFASDNEEEI